MTIRERLEQQEYMLLAPNAQKAAETKGRLYPAEENEVRTCYQRDADRIVHSKSFRRLMHKTQVFLSPEGDHYRTRMTHTLEVSRVARTICRALRARGGSRAHRYDGNALSPQRAVAARGG